MSIRQELAYLKNQKNINLRFCRGFAENGRNKDGSGKTIPCNYGQIAQDAALTTSPNITFPVELLSYWDPNAIKVLTAKRAATEIFDEVKKGKFADQRIFFKQIEETGGTKPYSDFSQSGMASVNYNFPGRDNYRFQTHIVVGDLENEMAGEAKVPLVGDKQRAATTSIAIDANKFYLFGVKGREIYGILNDPNLNASIAPATVNTNQTKWVNKTTQQRYEDILLLFQELVDQLGGLIDQTYPIKLCVSPSVNVMLGKSTDFNISVKKMLNEFFSNLTIVTVPELDSGTENTIFMIAPEVQGQVTGECVAPEKFRNYQPYRKISSFEQKVAGSTAGAVIYRPAAVATMVGV